MYYILVIAKQKMERLVMVRWMLDRFLKVDSQSYFSFQPLYVCHKDRDMSMGW